eukprot:6196555-Pleurochrysis_carterae.AAC.1
MLSQITSKRSGGAAVVHLRRERRELMRSQEHENGRLRGGRLIDTPNLKAEGTTERRFFEVARAKVNRRGNLHLKVKRFEYRSSDYEYRSVDTCRQK